MTAPFAIDPPGCGCTGCLTGESVPLDRATSEQITEMLVGDLIDRNGTPLAVTVSVTASHDGQEWDLTEGRGWAQVAGMVAVLAIRVQQEGATAP